MDMELDHACTNSGNYPLEWDGPDLRDLVFHSTAEGCCAFNNYDDCEAVPREDACTKLELANGDYLVTEVPWDLGSPARWRADRNVSSLSTGDASSASVTNVPVEGIGASSDLTLRMHVPGRATLRCLALVDTHMPFDNFVHYCTRVGGWGTCATYFFFAVFIHLVSKNN
jgi:hypothetical protein